MRRVRAKTVVSGTILAMAFSLLATGDAGAVVVLCKKGNKPLKVREGTCKGKETQVPASELGVTGPQGAQGGQGATGEEGPPGMPVALNYRAAAASIPQSFTFSGLQLTGLCSGGGAGSLEARTTSDDSVIKIALTNASGATYVEDDNFDVGDVVTLPFGDLDGSVSSLTYATPAGSIVTMTFFGESQTGSTFGGATDCALVGHATVTP